MAFNRLMLTTDGKTLYAKAQQGKPLHFTRVGLGDGLLGNGSLVNRPTMINERLSVPIDAIQMTAGATEAAVIVTLKNAALAEGFSFRELALFAKDPDTQSEKIYLYDHAGNDAEYIPAGSSGIAVYERLKLMIVADSTPNISFDASGNPLYVTAEELDARLLGYQEKLAGAVAKATPEDADKVPILDSADTSKPKLVLWSNIKALFAAATHVHAITDVTNLELSLSNKVTGLNTPRTLHVAKSGNDTTGDGSDAKPYLTIQKAIDALPNYFGVDATILIHAGTYDEIPTLYRIGGPGYLITRGAEGESVSVKALYCQDVWCHLTLQNLTITGEHPNDHASVLLQSCMHVNIWGVTCVQPISTTQIWYGSIFAAYCHIVFIQNTMVSNKQIAIDIVGSTVYLNDTVTGAGNVTAIRCGSGWGSYGGYVQKGGAKIVGAEEKAYGGQIW